ncbi:hypothetical protein Pcinc_004418 [Petrolisthes cinctipes]|uniref:THAP-type domain-containing protein n=1 Tax=Petrolisthes cinctipes TaxID=88211 RepID=A0AAE1GH98_PETCI|nr:hypothetical protein Pcinc_004418 [Petrolisthes cinctipes]
MSRDVIRNRWCFVPMCKSTDKSTPGKIFVSVPSSHKIRKDWWIAARREFPMAKSHIYCCEDHFNLQEDMDNYMYYTMMGGPIRLKSGVRPHKFDCQGKVTPHNENREKLKRKRSISKILSSVENIMEADQNPPSQPDPEEARNECEDLNDPESLTPSTKNVGIQVQIPPRIRSKAVQVVPLRADAACCTDGPEELVERSRTENTSDHSVSSSESSDVDDDDSIDYKPSDTTSGTDDDEAYRGFKEVEADLTARGCHLARPASVGKDEQLPAKKVVDMKIIAGLRIHLERVIRRIRVYKILDMHSCVPLSMMDVLDDIVRIVCGLVNLQERICKI